MTRIFTNVPSLTAQKALTNSMGSLSTSIQRLSTGLRINSGKDDPSGLIASEMLRSEIAGVTQAIKNTQQGNNMIAVADSALSAVSDLLVSIRGLVTEAANTAVMSPEMIAANQLQVDATLNAIDRIASSTTFMGRQMLDGSLNFVLEGLDRSTLHNVQVNEAQFGTNDVISVSVNVREMATKAELYYSHAAAMDDIQLTWKGNMGVGFSSFAKGTPVTDIAGVINSQSDATGVIAVLSSDATYGRMMVSSVGANNDILITANHAGVQGGFIEIKYTEGSDRGVFVDYVESLGPGIPSTLNVQLQTSSWKGSVANNVVVSNPFGVDQNSALNFLSNIPGAQFNGTSINVVDGNLTDAGFNDAAKNLSGVAGGVTAYYSEDAVSSKALVGGVNGMKGFANMPTGYLTLESVLKGTDANNVAIQFAVDDAATVRGAQPAKAVYTTDAAGNKLLTVYVNTTATPTTPVTSFSQIVAAINAEGTFKSNLIGPVGGGNLTITAPDCGTTGVVGNTNFSGGDKGTLFITATTDASTKGIPMLTGAKQTGYAADPTGVFSLSANQNMSPYNSAFFTIVTDSTLVTTGPPTFSFNNLTGQLTIAIPDDFSVGFAAIEAEFLVQRAIPGSPLANFTLTYSDPLVPPTIGPTAVDFGGFSFDTGAGATGQSLITVRPHPNQSPQSTAKIEFYKDNTLLSGPVGPGTVGTAQVQYDSVHNVLKIGVSQLAGYETTMATIATAMQTSGVPFSINFGTAGPTDFIVDNATNTLPQSYYMTSIMGKSTNVQVIGNPLTILSDTSSLSGLTNLNPLAVPPDAFGFQAKTSGFPVDNTTFKFVLDDNKASAPYNCSYEYDMTNRQVLVYVKEDFTTTFQDLMNQLGADSSINKYFTVSTNLSAAALGNDVLAPADMGLFYFAQSDPLPGGIGKVSVDNSLVRVSNSGSNLESSAKIIFTEDPTTVNAQVPPGPVVSYDRGANTITVLVDTTTAAKTTFQQVKDAFDTAATISQGNGAYFPFRISFGSTDINPPVPAPQPALTIADVPAGGSITVMMKGTATSSAIRTVNNSQDLVNVFNLNIPQSIGSERAAEMFNVLKSIDNDGTGLVYSQRYNDVFQDGVTGGQIISTAEQVVAALNHSEYWNTMMTSNQLAAWIAEAKNPSGINSSTVQDPILWAMLAPGDHGLSVVSAFQEVAYYGSPYDGTGIQFLGTAGSPAIRFVADKGTNVLSVDSTTFPDVLGYSQAILNGVNPNSQIVITANQKGAQNDDVLFQFVRVTEDPTANPPVLRPNGWVTYDEGVSYAQTTAIFKDKVTGDHIQNTAFTVTANDRGEEYNNVSVQMRQNAQQQERVVVSYDYSRNVLMVSLRSDAVDSTALPAGETVITSKEVVNAINAYQGATGVKGTGGTFNAALSNATVTTGPANNGAGTFGNIGLTTQFMEIGNTGKTGGHTGGTVTVYLTGEKDETGAYKAPTAAQIVSLLNGDDIVGNKFTARPYITGSAGGSGAVDFVKDNYIATAGGIVQEGVLTVHLRTDSSGIPLTTAAELVAFWDTLTAEQSRGISASLWREPGSEWDICNDNDGRGIVTASTVSNDLCNVVTYKDIMFAGWGTDPKDPVYSIPAYSQGTMVAINGVNASYSLVARQTGADFDGYSLVYSEDPTLTGQFIDNSIDNNGLSDGKGLRLELDKNSKTITVFVRQGITSAGDVKQLIESDPATKLLFEVQLHGDGTGRVDVRDDTLFTRGGTLPPSELNGAKLLGGMDATSYAMKFVSTQFGSSKYVEVTEANGKFFVTNEAGQSLDRAYGSDANVLINGVQATGNGLSVSLNTSALSVQMTLAEGTAEGYNSSFFITGGGATFQMGPRVVSNQQITLGIPSIYTAELGGPSGRLTELRDGKSAALAIDPTRAYQIIDESIVLITQIRGRLGTIQAATFEPNISVLQDTLESLSTAQSEIRDTDFAAETSALTRGQVLVQSGINALGVANQLPNYILSLLR